MPVLNHAGLKLNYQLVGPPPTPEAPPVALIHGLGANIAFWYLGALRHLRRDRTFVLHDLRGHGASSMPDRGYGLEQMAGDFRALLDGLGIARAHVVGHSHGARVALAFALTCPGRVASLTLADTQIRALQAPVRLGDWPHWPRWKADLEARGVSRFPSEDALIDFRLLAELGPRSAGGRGGRCLADTASPGPGGRLAGALARSGPGAGPGAGPVPGLVQGPIQGPGAVRLRRRTARAAVADLRADTGADTGADRGADTGADTGTGRGGGRGAERRARRIDLQSRQMGARGAGQWQALMERTGAVAEMHDESAIRIADLGRLSMPVLLIYGQYSHCVPTAERLAALLPDARLLLVPGGGHFFPIVKPRAFARALSVFLARVGASAGAGAGASAGVGGDGVPAGRAHRVARRDRPRNTPRLEPVFEPPRPAAPRPDLSGSDLSGSGPPHPGGTGRRGPGLAARLLRRVR